MDRQRQALELAEQLLTDIEFNRISVHQLVLKASRLARLTGDTEAAEWLQFEINSCPDSTAGRKHISRSGRYIDRDKNEGHCTPIGSIQAYIESYEDALAALALIAFLENI